MTLRVKSQDQLATNGNHSRRTKVVRHVREIIGRVVYDSNFWTRYNQPSTKTVDETIPNYAFYDRLRRGKEPGYEYAGLFAKPVSQIMTSWVLGTKFGVQLVEGAAEGQTANVEHTNDLLTRFVNRIRGRLIQVVEDHYALGEQYIVVNADGSLSIPPPNTVDFDTDILDYRQKTRYVITSILDGVTITDEYTLTQRTLTIHYTDKNKADEIYQFPNLIGRLPVVHLANDRSSNETHGRSIIEAMWKLLSKYNDLVDRAFAGTELMSNPVPVFEGVEDIDETLTNNSTETDEEYYDTDGNLVTRIRLAFDRLKAIIVGKGGRFHFASPQSGFTQDTFQMLKLAFYLILDYTRLPEVVWGNELGQARASAGEQMKTFYSFIESRQIALAGEGADEVLTMPASGGLLELFDIWLRYRNLIDPQVLTGPTQIDWEPVSETDQKITLDWVRYLHSTGELSGESAREISPLDIDEDSEVQRLETEREEAQARLDEQQQYVRDLQFLGEDEETETEPAETEESAA